MFQQPYFQLSYPQDIKLTIESKKSNCEFDKTIFHSLDEKIHELKEKKKHNSGLVHFFKKLDEFNIDQTEYILRFFNFYNDQGETDPNLSIGYIVLDQNEYNNPEKCCRMIETKKKLNYKKNRNFVEKKFNKIASTMVGEEIYQSKLANKSYCDRSLVVKNIRLNLLYKLFDVLEKGGDVLLAHIYNICDCDIIEFFYLCSILFEKIIIVHFTDFFIYGQNFLFDNRITKEDFKKKVYSPFTVEPKVEYDSLIDFLTKSAKERIREINLLLDKKYDEYLLLYTMDIIKKAENFKLSKDFIKLLQKKMIEMFRMVYIENKVVKIHSAIKGEEARSIQETLKKYNCKKCIEVGMAFGISAFYILSTSPDITLISIDPNQTKRDRWDSSALKLLKKMDLDKNHELIEKKSYVGLPELLAKYGEGSFDFVFIDGFHVFDYTLIDAFYSFLLIKVGGIIMIDDILHNGVAKCVKYMDSNYEFLKRIPSTKTQAAYIKMKDDDRPWNYHQPF